MKQYKWKISLLRKMQLIAEKEVYEFDDECLNQNLWSQACQVFNDMLQDKDVIKVDGDGVEYIQYEATTGYGTVLN